MPTRNLDINQPTRLQWIRRSPPLHHLWCWTITNSQAITAIAAVLGAMFTAIYLIATIRVFKEARKSADTTAEAARAAFVLLQKRNKVSVLLRLLKWAC
jgi:hypothetical protein